MMFAMESELQNYETTKDFQLTHYAQATFVEVPVLMKKEDAIPCLEQVFIKDQGYKDRNIKVLSVLRRFLPRDYVHKKQQDYVDKKQRDYVHKKQ